MKPPGWFRDSPLRDGLITFGLVLALASAAVGCGEEKVAHPSAAETLATAESALSKQDTPQRDESDAVVASGDRVHIDLDKFEHFLKEHPELDKDQALDQLIDRDLLADEALERDLQTDSTLGVVRKRAMVRELLRARVEDEITEDKITEDETRRCRREDPPRGRPSAWCARQPPGRARPAG